MTYKELYLSGDIEFEEIDDYISQWNSSDETITLREFLGLNAEEEDIWIDEGETALLELLDTQINK